MLGGVDGGGSRTPAQFDPKGPAWPRSATDEGLRRALYYQYFYESSY